MSIEFDETLFETSFEKFFEFCNKVITYKSTGLKVNPIMVKMNKFKKVVDLMKPTELKTLFIESIYVPNKYNLLESNSDHSWILENDVSMSIGKNKERILMCSTVYKKALKLKAECEKSLEKLPESACEEAEELNFPDIFLLYLFRMLKASVEESNDNATVSKILSGIESDLGITNSNNPEVKNNNANPMPSGNPLGDILSNLGPMLGNLTKNMNSGNGNKGGNGQMQMPNIANLLSGLTSGNPQLSKMVGETFGDLSDCKNPADMLGKVVRKLNNPELQSMIQNGL